MGAFTKHKLHSQKNMTIVNVGSYKVRVLICSFSLGEIEILGYGEKRQSRLDIINNEISSMSGVCETIAQAISTAELQAGVAPKKIIVNPFFSNSFFYSKTIHYKHTDNGTVISKKDVFKIINHIESLSVSSIANEIESKFGIPSYDLHLVISNIAKLYINGKQEDTLLGKYGEDITIHILNALIPKINSQIIQDISHFIGKKIYKIIPEEYALLKVLESNTRMIFLDIGNSLTSISLQNADGELIGSISLNIGIGNLIKDIKKNSTKSRTEIIKKLDRDDLFVEEKKVFLPLFAEIITAGLFEILGGNVCPHSFTLIGGGANNIFIKEYLSNLHFQDYNIKILQKPEFIAPSIRELKKIKGIENILNTSNIPLIAQTIMSQDILFNKKGVIEKALQSSIENIFE